MLIREEKRKYLIPIITSVVASVLLICICVAAIVSGIISSRVPTAVIHNSESDTDYFYQNDGVIHMSVEIPAAKVKAESDATVTVSLGNGGAGELPLPESVRLTVLGSYEVSGGEPFEIMKGKTELDGGHVYHGFSSSKYACRDCHGEGAKGNKLGCDFDFSEKLTFKYTREQSGVRQGAIVFRVSGESSLGENGESAKWLGEITVYFIADGEYVAFGDTADVAARIFYGDTLPGEMDCEV